MRKIILFVLSISAFQVYGQSPWTQKKEKAYVQLSYTLISDYNRLYGSPDYSSERSVTDNTLHFYGEYGLTDKTSLIFSVPFKMVETGGLVNSARTPISKAGSKSALGNIEIGLKHNFIQSKWLFSGQFNIEANTGSYDSATGLRTGYDAWSFTPLLITGRGFKNMFIQGHMGLNIRNQNYSSNFRAGGEFGINFFKKIWAIGFINISSSLKNGTIVVPEINRLNALYVNDQEFSAIGVKFIGEFSSKFGVTAGFATVLSGNNLPQSLPATFGLYYKL